jgi:integrase
MGANSAKTTGATQSGGNHRHAQGGEKRSTRDWAMVLVAYRLGMRASEVCNLRMDDVDLKRQAITVCRLKGSLDTVQLSGKNPF